MKISDELRSHLAGRAFSSGLQVVVADRREPVEDRVQLLAEHLAGRSVVHVGCVDHLPLLDQKIANGTWLHAAVAASASRCLGVDINCAGIERLRLSHHRTDVVCGDITTDAIEEVEAASWDCFLLADVVEHLDDPIGFLRAVRERHAGRFDELVVTVPNALCRENRRLASRQIENVNTDHRFWFTPFTVAKVATLAGFDVRSVRYAEFKPRTRLGRLRARFRRPSRGLDGDTLVVALVPRRGG